VVRRQTVDLSALQEDVEEKQTEKRERTDRHMRALSLAATPRRRTSRSSIVHCCDCGGADSFMLIDADVGRLHVNVLRATRTASI
jgi:hypothetical protein